MFSCLVRAKRVLFFLLVGFLLLIPSLGWSTTIIRLSEAQLVERSTLIIRGHVLRKVSKWNKNHLAIITLVTVRVEEELLHRKAPYEVIVRHYGGTVGKQTMGLSSRPHFFVNQEVILFLQTSPYLPNEFLLTGWTQGIWNVERSKASFASFSKGIPKKYRAFVSQQSGFAAIRKLPKLVGVKVKPSFQKKRSLPKMIKHWQALWHQKKKNIRLPYVIQKKVLKLKHPIKILRLKMLKPNKR